MAFHRPLLHCVLAFGLPTTRDVVDLASRASRSACTVSWQQSQMIHLLLYPDTSRARRWSAQLEARAAVIEIYLTNVGCG